MHGVSAFQRDMCTFLLQDHVTLQLNLFGEASESRTSAAEHSTLRDQSHDNNRAYSSDPEMTMLPAISETRVLFTTVFSVVLLQAAI